MWWLNRYGFMAFIDDDTFYLSRINAPTDFLINMLIPCEEMGIHKFDCHIEDVLDYIGLRCSEDTEQYDLYAGVFGSDALATLITLVLEQEGVEF